MTREPRSSDHENALLRAVDWRFLLPNPAPRVAIFSDANSLRQAIDLIARHATELGKGQDCDLAVLEDPDRSELAATHAALRPGGWCYTVWRRPIAGLMTHARARLQAAGFRDVACYWPARARTTVPRAWLPLDASGALRYFWRMQTVRRPRHRLRRFARRVLWQGVWRAGLIRPVCTIARRPFAPGSDLSCQTPALLDVVRSNWLAWRLGTPPARLSCLLLTGGNRSISKCVALIFEEPSARPRLAVKLARVPEAVPALEREAAVLNELHSRHPGALSGIPKVIFSGTEENHALLVETVLTGVPLQSELRRSNFRALAFRAADWLADFAQRTARHSSRDWYRRIAEPATGDFEASFHDVADRALLRRTRDMLATIGPLPIISEQRDFSPWNVLLDARGALIVLDWESAELDGLPALDLIYFMTYLAFVLDRVPIDVTSQRLRRSYRRLLDPTTFTGGVWKACLTHYGRRVGLDPEQLNLLSVLAWLIHSRSDYRRFAADAGGRPDQRALQRSVFLSLWEEEMRTRTHIRYRSELILHPLARQS
jgi:hypothetical protein